MTGNPQGRRPWFGPNRVGYGLHPQTWEGWLITVAFVIVVILIAALTR